MAYLFDTCALSELVAIKRNSKAIEKILALPREEIFLAAITIGEIQNGIDTLVPCARKNFLKSWLEGHVLPLYADHTLSVDILVARAWGVLAANLKGRGLTMQIKDSLIAATALVHNLTVVTRNESDFDYSGVRILNPWK